MVLIEITKPIEKYIINDTTQKEVDNIMENIQNSLNSEKSINKEISNYLNEIGIEAAIIGGAAIGTIIAMIKHWITSKYSIMYKRIASQSKELNDLYTKVEFLLKHDKIARFKHRNDVIECDIKDVLLADPDNPRKHYQITLDYMAYNPEYFINEIKEIMNYIDQYSKENRNKDLENMKSSLIKIIDDDFNKYHWFIRLNPIMKTEHYKNVKLEKVLIMYKNNFEVHYNNIAVINSVVASQMQYMQLTEQAYNRMMAEYGKSKDGKKLVDDIFKKLLKNMTDSMKFNSTIMELLSEKIKFCTQELEKLYNIIKS